LTNKKCVVGSETGTGVEGFFLKNDGVTCASCKTASNFASS